MEQLFLEEAFHNGVPIQIRGDIWQLIVPNSLNITPQFYQSLKERVQISITNGNADINFRKNLKVIEEDLFRTFSELNIFYNGTKLYQPLKNVLLAYSVMRPEIGYV